MKKSIEIGSYFDKIRNCEVKCLIVDGKQFGWGVLPDSLNKTKTVWTADPSLCDPIMMDIHNHFIKSFSKFLGKDVTIKEVNEAISQGYVDV